MGVVLPEKNFLHELLAITRKNGALFIVDEVITGFRLHNGGVQQLFGIDADLTTLGKIIGGGVPVAAYGGRAELMNHVAPFGPVYQAGTLAGNPLAMSAGIATLCELQRGGLYEGIARNAQRLVSGLQQCIDELKLKACVNSMGSLATLFFTDGPVRNYDDARKSDKKKYARYFREMLDRGIFLAPSQYEAAFVSAAHTTEDIDLTVSVARECLQAMSAEDAESTGKVTRRMQDA
jgi:glutamate-1-semialdehyde 2,1-aminomutase